MGGYCLSKDKIKELYYLDIFNVDLKKVAPFCIIEKNPEALIKLFYKNCIMLHKVGIHFNQSFSKWIPFASYQIEVCKTFLIKFYSKPIYHSTLITEFDALEKEHVSLDKGFVFVYYYGQ
ncbi:hypothetical protein [Bacillus mycoides]|uniref:hypothetical protein n=1 Tax=Bacillus mycoides TaxID=1405 RepID=UPI0008724CEC|nr:hypothetical protein [Bacillus mycoides]